MARAAIWILAVPLLLWAALALHFAGPRPALFANALAVGVVLAGLAILVRVRPATRALLALAVLAALFIGWWSTVRPRNDRAWLPDVVRLRTNHREPREQVYLYPMRTPLVRARAILLDYVASINGLAAAPEFYNAASANCTTTIRIHVDNIGATMPLDWRLIVNGYLDQMLYEYGVIDTSRPFARRV